MRASWVEVSTPRRPRSRTLARVVESCVAGASSDLASGDDAFARVVATAVVKRGASALGAASEEFGGDGAARVGARDDGAAAKRWAASRRRRRRVRTTVLALERRRGGGGADVERRVVDAREGAVLRGEAGRKRDRASGTGRDGRRGRSRWARR